MPRRRNWPASCWHFDFHTPMSLSDWHGELLSIAGTVALDTAGRMRAPGDLAAQTEMVMEEVRMILEGAGTGMDALAKLVAFYVADRATGHAELLRAVESRLPSPRPALTAVPVSNLAFPGMMLEVEGFALAEASGRALPRSPGLDGVVRGGDMLFIEGRATQPEDRRAGEGELEDQTEAALDRLQSRLTAAGAGIADVVRLNVYLNDEPRAVERAGARLARRFAAPGPVVTFVLLPALGIAGQRLELDVLAMPGRGGRAPARRVLPGPWPWSWPSDWPFVQALRCGDAVFVGGQGALGADREVLHPGDLEAQTRMVMDRIVEGLERLDARIDDVMKVGCWYSGEASVDTLKRNALIRTSYFAPPGPTSTGVPVLAQHRPGMQVQVDVIAMAAQPPQGGAP